MMMYSVWNHGSRTYDYYRTPGNSSATASPKPTHLKSSVLGLSPEKAGWPLPSNAKLVGHGKYPKGHIASKNGGSALGIIPDMTMTNVVLMGTLGFMVYKFLWEPSRGR